MHVNQYRFSGDNKFEIKKFDTSDTGVYAQKEELVNSTKESLKQMKKIQDKLYAQAENGILIIFQALDAAGKDGAVKHVFSGINPQGVNVYNFKQPSAEELRHDYLWRAEKNMPERGKIAIFNRSYYEDVLVAKVHKLYKVQNLPGRCLEDDIIEKRYKQIKNYEEYFWENGMTIIKFFLNVSKEEQQKRILARIDDKSKNWKFSKNDLHEREFWDDYQEAYEIAINETATKKCPWYVIPADKKWYARALIAEIIVQTLKETNPEYPALSPEAEQELAGYRKNLV